MNAAPTNPPDLDAPRKRLVVLNKRGRIIGHGRYGEPIELSVATGGIARLRVIALHVLKKRLGRA